MDLVPITAMGYAEIKSGEAPLLVPATTVLRTGRRAVVYVRLPERDRPVFEGREVVLGPKTGQSYLVRSDLQEGDEVVTQGAFKIDSALQILAKPSMMSPENRDEGPGTDHAEMEMPTPTKTTAVEPALPLGLTPPSAAQLLPAYFALQTALALKTMMAIIDHHGPLPDLIHVMLSADNLDTIRKPSFDELSQAMIAAVKADPTAFEGEILKMHCPMVYEDRGADWIQSSDPLRNPFFGAMMLECGEVVGKLK
ncbi:MAG: DUF3347 domain-containing protein [Candidatus Synoicihabitans palmerolidicus]|nr:DUF3347 domain-containing protein [Candidatus Synoicihabitans palmerolidicus]